MEGQGEAIPFPEWCRLSHGVSGERCRCHELPGLEPHPSLRRGADPVPVECWYLQVVCDLENNLVARAASSARPATPAARAITGSRTGLSTTAPYQPIKDHETGLIRIFIPAKINDNPALLDNDPELYQPPAGLRLPALVRAWLDGDWNVIEGAFFPEFDPNRHVITPFRMPLHWTRFRSHGLGLARAPSRIGWWVVVQEDFIHDKRRIPKNAIIRYREWYGASSAPTKACDFRPMPSQKRWCAVKPTVEDSENQSPTASWTLPPSRSCQVRQLVRRLHVTACSSGVPITRVFLRRSGWVVGIRSAGGCSATTTATP